MLETNSYSSNPFVPPQKPVEVRKKSITFERVIIVALLLIMCAMIYLIVKNQIHIQTMSEELIALRILVQTQQNMNVQQA